MDTCVTYHTTSYGDMLPKSSSYYGDATVMLGNDSTILITHIRYIGIINNFHDLKLKHLLYVSQFDKILF